VPISLIVRRGWLVFELNLKVKSSAINAQYNAELLTFKLLGDTPMMLLLSVTINEGINNYRLS
jgi:hypothetical protein